MLIWTMNEKGIFYSTSTYALFLQYKPFSSYGSRDDNFLWHVHLKWYNYSHVDGKLKGVCNHYTFMFCHEPLPHSLSLHPHDIHWEYAGSFASPVAESCWTKPLAQSFSFKQWLQAYISSLYLQWSISRDGKEELSIRKMLYHMCDPCSYS